MYFVRICAIAALQHCLTVREAYPGNAQLWFQRTGRSAVQMRLITLLLGSVEDSLLVGLSEFAADQRSGL